MKNREKLEALQKMLKEEFEGIIIDDIDESSEECIYFVVQPSKSTKEQIQFSEGMTLAFCLNPFKREKEWYFCINPWVSLRWNIEQLQELKKVTQRLIELNPTAQLVYEDDGSWDWNPNSSLDYKGEYMVKGDDESEMYEKFDDQIEELEEEAREAADEKILEEVEVSTTGSLSDFETAQTKVKNAVLKTALYFHNVAGSLLSETDLEIGIRRILSMGDEEYVAAEEDEFLDAVDDTNMQKVIRLANLDIRSGNSTESC